MRLRHVAAALAAAVFSLVAVAVPASAQQPPALRVCTTGDYPPYSVSDGNGGYRGIDIELVRGLADLIGRPLHVVPVTWASMKTDFAAQDCDLAVGGISDSPARRAFADFSLTYGTDGKAPITRAADADNYATIEQINRPEVRVIVNRGGTNEDFARRNFPDAQLTVWPDNVTIFSEIDQGRADVFVTDSVEGRYRARQHPGLVVLHPERPFDSFGKIFLLRRNDPVLAAEVNGWLGAQLATGTVDRLFADWIGPNATA
ncbi:transporter substrate-binding domain-containing protein [Nocardia transvalensis]|uniref:transporter substrate-binding domain-containing protein n=1 Tax=Nocardia transvalensis TaxID=37333 RepID=UPI001894CA79|nr:transporter substrate-binding domain-containing protein [Nocardia transvalensis]MBF6331025.1 transporter substrate-binding domain-containing protein [Nocardia transvalensis]